MEKFSQLWHSRGDLTGVTKIFVGVGKFLGVTSHPQQPPKRIIQKYVHLVGYPELDFHFFQKLKFLTSYTGGLNDIFVGMCRNIEDISNIDCNKKRSIQKYVHLVG